MNNFIKDIKLILKGDINYIQNIEEKKWLFFIILLTIDFLTVNFFNIISDHTFPKDFALSNLNLSNLSPLLFIYSSILSFFITYILIISFLIINFKIERFAFLFLYSIILSVLVILFSFNSPHTLSLISAVLILTGLIYVISRNIKVYSLLVRIMISLSILTVTGNFINYLLGLLKNEPLYVLFNLTLLAYYLFLYIKMIKIRFNFSVKKIIFYSLFAEVLGLLYCLLLYKLDIFDPAIFKLLIYQ